MVAHEHWAKRVTQCTLKEPHYDMTTLMLRENSESTKEIYYMSIHGLVHPEKHQKGSEDIMS